MKDMEKYAFVTRPDDVSFGIREEIRKRLDPAAYAEDEKNPDTVFVIGGDGTFIYAVHQYIDQLDDVRFYGIHTGTLGFYTDFEDRDFEAFMDVFLQKKWKEVYYPLLTCEAGDQTFYAINEIRIENAARSQEVDILINDEYFEKFRGTGLCICTQLGSTAYNRSLGGAVIQDGLDLIQITEIAGIHHSKCRSLDAPFVLKGDSRITLKASNFRGAVLGVDADAYPICEIGEVRIHVCECTRVRMLQGRKVSYLKKLQSLF